MLCPAFAPSPDVSHMKDLFCDAELKYYQDNAPNNTQILSIQPIWCDCMAPIEAMLFDYALLFGVGFYDLHCCSLAPFIPIITDIISFCYALGLIP